MSLIGDSVELTLPEDLVQTLSDYPQMRSTPHLCAGHLFILLSCFLYRLGIRPFFLNEFVNPDELAQDFAAPRVEVDVEEEFGSPFRA
jgi:hypothetical protein